MTKSALFVWGGWDGHQPHQCVDLFAPYLEEQDYHVRVSTSLDSFLDIDLLAALDLIVPIYTMSTLTDEQERGLRESLLQFAGSCRA